MPVPNPAWSLLRLAERAHQAKLLHFGKDHAAEKTCIARVVCRAGCPSRCAATELVPMAGAGEKSGGLPCTPLDT